MTSLLFAAVLFGAAPELSTPTERVDFLTEHLDAGAPAARLWWYGWAIGYGVGTAAQAAIGAATSDRALRANMVVGAGSTLVGMLAILVSPLPVMSGSSDVPEDESERLQALEERLRMSAEAQTFGRSWIAHMLCGVVALAQGLILWLAYDLPVDGVVNGAISLAVGEAQILTQPTRAIDDWASYQARTSDARTGFILVPGGLGFVLAFD